MATIISPSEFLGGTATSGWHDVADVEELSPQKTGAQAYQQSQQAAGTGLPTDSKPVQGGIDTLNNDGIIDTGIDALQSGAARMIGDSAGFFAHTLNSEMLQDFADKMNKIADDNTENPNNFKDDQLRWLANAVGNGVGTSLPGIVAGTALALMAPEAGTAAALGSVARLGANLPKAQAAAGVLTQILSKFPTARAVASSLGSAIPAGAMGRFIVGEMAGDALEAAAEGGGVVRELRKKGYSDDQISSRKWATAGENLVYLWGTDLLAGKMLGQTDKIINSVAQRYGKTTIGQHIGRMASPSVSHAMAKIGMAMPIKSAKEGLEEFGQEYIQAVNTDEPFSIERGLEAAKAGAATGAFFGLIGGGASSYADSRYRSAPVSFELKDKDTGENVKYSMQRGGDYQINNEVVAPSAYYESLKKNTDGEVDVADEVLPSSPDELVRNPKSNSLNFGLGKKYFEQYAEAALGLEEADVDEQTRQEYDELIHKPQKTLKDYENIISAWNKIKDDGHAKRSIKTINAEREDRRQAVDKARAEATESLNLALGIQQEVDRRRNANGQNFNEIVDRFNAMPEESQKTYLEQAMKWAESDESGISKEQVESVKNFLADQNNSEEEKRKAVLSLAKANGFTMAKARAMASGKAGNTRTIESNGKQIDVIKQRRADGTYSVRATMDGKSNAMKIGDSEQVPRFNTEQEAEDYIKNLTSDNVFNPAGHQVQNQNQNQEQAQEQAPKKNSAKSLNGKKGALIRHQNGKNATIGDLKFSHNSTENGFHAVYTNDNSTVIVTPTENGYEALIERGGAFQSVKVDGTLNDLKKAVLEAMSPSEKTVENKTEASEDTENKTEASTEDRDTATEKRFDETEYTHEKTSIEDEIKEFTDGQGVYLSKDHSVTGNRYASARPEGVTVEEHYKDAVTADSSNFDAISVEGTPVDYGTRSRWYDNMMNLVKNAVIKLAKAKGVNIRVEDNVDKILELFNEDIPEGAPKFQYDEESGTFFRNLPNGEVQREAGRAFKPTKNRNEYIIAVPKDGKILDAPMHEFGHVWWSLIDDKLKAHIVELMRGTRMYEKMKADPIYSKAYPETDNPLTNKLAEETFMRLIGKYATEYNHNTNFVSEIQGVPKSRFKRLLHSFINKVRSVFGLAPMVETSDNAFQEALSMPLREVLQANEDAEEKVAPAEKEETKEELKEDTEDRSEEYLEGASAAFEEENKLQTNGDYESSLISGFEGKKLNEVTPDVYALARAVYRENVARYMERVLGGDPTVQYATAPLKHHSQKILTTARKQGIISDAEYNHLAELARMYRELNAENDKADTRNASAVVREAKMEAIRRVFEQILVRGADAKNFKKMFKDATAEVLQVSTPKNLYSTLLTMAYRTKGKAYNNIDASLKAATEAGVISKKMSDEILKAWPSNNVNEKTLSEWQDKVTELFNKNKAPMEEVYNKDDVNFTNVVPHEISRMFKPAMQYQAEAVLAMENCWENSPIFALTSGPGFGKTYVSVAEMMATFIRDNEANDSAKPEKEFRRPPSILVMCGNDATKRSWEKAVKFYNKLLTEKEITKIIDDDKEIKVPNPYYIENASPIVLNDGKDSMDFKNGEIYNDPSKRVRPGQTNRTVYLVTYSKMNNTKAIHDGSWDYIYADEVHTVQGNEGGDWMATATKLDKMMSKPNVKTVQMSATIMPYIDNIKNIQKIILGKAKTPAERQKAMKDFYEDILKEYRNMMSRSYERRESGYYVRNEDGSIAKGHRAYMDSEIVDVNGEKKLLVDLLQELGVAKKLVSIDSIADFLKGNDLALVKEEFKKVDGELTQAGFLEYLGALEKLANYKTALAQSGFTFEKDHFNNTEALMATGKVVKNLQEEFVKKFFDYAKRGHRITSYDLLNLGDELLRNAPNVKYSEAAKDFEIKLVDGEQRTLGVSEKTSDGVALSKVYEWAFYNNLGKIYEVIEERIKKAVKANPNATSISISMEDLKGELKRVPRRGDSIYIALSRGKMVTNSTNREGIKRIAELAQYVTNGTFLSNALKDYLESAEDYYEFSNKSDSFGKNEFFKSLKELKNSLNGKLKAFYKANPNDMEKTNLADILEKVKATSKEVAKYREASNVEKLHEGLVEEDPNFIFSELEIAFRLLRGTPFTAFALRDSKYYDAKRAMEEAFLHIKDNKGLDESITALSKGKSNFEGRVVQARDATRVSARRCAAMANVLKKRGLVYGEASKAVAKKRRETVLLNQQGFADDSKAIVSLSKLLGSSKEVKQDIASLNKSFLNAFDIQQGIESLITLVNSLKEAYNEDGMVKDVKKDALYDTLSKLSKDLAGNKESSATTLRHIMEIGKVLASCAEIKKQRLLEALQNKEREKAYKAKDADTNTEGKQRNQTNSGNKTYPAPFIPYHSRYVIAVSYAKGFDTKFLDALLDAKDKRNDLAGQLLKKWAAKNANFIALCQSFKGKNSIDVATAELGTIASLNDEANENDDGIIITSVGGRQGNTKKVNINGQEVDSITAFKNGDIDVLVCTVDSVAEGVDFDETLQPAYYDENGNLQNFDEKTSPKAKKSFIDAFADWNNRKTHRNSPVTMFVGMLPSSPQQLTQLEERIRRTMTVGDAKVRYLTYGTDIENVAFYKQNLLGVVTDALARGESYGADGWVRFDDYNRVVNSSKTEAGFKAAERVAGFTAASKQGYGNIDFDEIGKFGRSTTDTLANLEYSPERQTSADIAWSDNSLNTYMQSIMADERKKTRHEKLARAIAISQKISSVQAIYENDRSAALDAFIEMIKGSQDEAIDFSKDRIDFPQTWKTAVKKLNPKTLSLMKTALEYNLPIYNTDGDHFFAVTDWYTKEKPKNASHMFSRAEAEILLALRGQNMNDSVKINRSEAINKEMENKVDFSTSLDVQDAQIKMFTVRKHPMLEFHQTVRDGSYWRFSFDVRHQGWTNITPHEAEVLANLATALGKTDNLKDLDKLNLAGAERTSDELNMPQDPVSKMRRNIRRILSASARCVDGYEKVEDKLVDYFMNKVEDDFDGRDGLTFYHAQLAEVAAEYEKMLQKELGKTYVEHSAEYGLYANALRDLFIEVERANRGRKNPVRKFNIDEIKAPALPSAKGLNKVQQAVDDTVNYILETMGFSEEEIEDSFDEELLTLIDVINCDISTRSYFAIEDILANGLREGKIDENFQSQIDQYAKRSFADATVFAQAKGVSVEEILENQEKFRIGTGSREAFGEVHSVDYDSSIVPLTREELKAGIKTKENETFEQKTEEFIKSPYDFTKPTRNALFIDLVDKNDSLHGIDRFVDFMFGRTRKDSGPIYEAAQGSAATAAGYAHTVAEGDFEEVSKANDIRGLTGTSDELNKIGTIREMLARLKKLIEDKDPKVMEFIKKYSDDNPIEAIEYYLSCVIMNAYDVKFEAEYAQRMNELIAEGKALPAEREHLKLPHDWTIDQVRAVLRDAGWEFQTVYDADGTEHLVCKGYTEWRTITDEDGKKARIMVNHIEGRDNDIFKGVAEAHRELQANMLKMLHHDGIISTLSRDTMIIGNPDYAPMSRDMTSEAGFNDTISSLSNGGSGMANVRTPIKRREKKGSTKDMIAPLETTLKSIAVVANRCTRNRVARMAIGGVNNAVNARIAYLRNKAATASTAEERQKAAMDALVLDTDRTNVAVIPIVPFRQKGFKHADRERCVFTVMEKGKVYTYQTTSEYYDAIVGYNPIVFRGILKAAENAASVLRAGATVQPSFIIRNFLRDTFFASVSSENGFKWGIDSIRGYLALKDPKFRAEYQAHGIGAFNFYNDLAMNAQNLKDIGKFSGDSVDKANKEFRKFCSCFFKGFIMGGVFNKKAGANLAKAAWHFTKAPAEIAKGVYGKFRDFSDIAESSTRAGEYLLAKKNKAKELRANKIKNGLTDRQIDAMAMRYAAVQARNITLDFSRNGRYGRYWNKWTPFFNAAIQGSDKIRQLINRDGYGKFAFKVIKNILLPTIGCYVAQMIHSPEDRFTVNDSMKYSYWLIPLWNGNYARVPKPQELGVVFGSLIEAVLDTMFLHDSEAMHAWAHEAWGVIQPNLFPTIVAPIYEWSRNYNNLVGRPIETKRVEGLPFEQRFTPTTSYTSRYVAKHTQTDWTQRNLEISPLKLDNTVRGYFGTGGYLVWNYLGMLDPDYWNNRLSFWWEEYPVRDVFVFKDNHTQDVTRYYAYTSKLDMKAKGGDEEAKKKLDKIHDYHFRMGSTTFTISQANKELIAIQNGEGGYKDWPREKRRQKKDELTQNIRRTARRVLMDNWEEAKYMVPSRTIMGLFNGKVNSEDDLRDIMTNKSTRKRKKDNSNAIKDF